jgi:hypothetical protein
MGSATLHRRRMAGSVPGRGSGAAARHVTLGSVPPPTIRNSRTIMLPLREEAIAACPRGRGLFPDPNAVEILRDKRRFTTTTVTKGKVFE